MEAIAETAPVNPGSTTLYFIIAFLIALAAGGVAYIFILNKNSMPPGTFEGFQGPTKGVSDIPCGQESSFAVRISEIFSTKTPSSQEAEGDLKEFKLILSKLCCLKHDLMSPRQVVQATLYLPFRASHDRENPADTTGRCFSKSLPPRDLEISFDTWRDRALTLLDRLFVSYTLSPAEAEDVKSNLLSVWSDTYSIAKGVCSPVATPPVDGGPRDPKGFMSESIKSLGEYTGYY